MRPVHLAIRCSTLCGLVLAGLVSATGAGADAPSLPVGIHREIIAHPSEPELQVELYWKAPEGEGRVPAMLLVHGHQFGDRPGARLYVDRGLLDPLVAKGFVAAAVSQPGYGQSDGPPDFCGPRSQQAVLGAVEALRRHPRVDPERIALYGYSRGAAVAAMAASHDDELAALVLGAGEYDLFEAIHLLDEEDRIQGAIKRNIIRESGGTPEALRLRSPLRSEPIRVPTLILHGEDDTRTRAEGARALELMLRKAGTPVELAVFPGVGHSIPRELRQEITDRFLERYLVGTR